MVRGSFAGHKQGVISLKHERSCPISKVTLVNLIAVCCICPALGSVEGAISSRIFTFTKFKVP